MHVAEAGQGFPVLLLPRVSRALVLVAASDARRWRRRAFAPSRRISAATAAPMRRRRSARIRSIIWSAISPDCSMRSRSRRRWSSATIGAASSPGRWRCWPPHRVARRGRHQHAVLSAPADAPHRADARDVAGQLQLRPLFPDTRRRGGGARRATCAARCAAFCRTPIARGSKNCSRPVRRRSVRRAAGCSIACPTRRTASFSAARTSRCSRRTFERTGFRGGLNWYRNFDCNWETTAYLSGAKVQPPALMITAELDPGAASRAGRRHGAWVPNLRATHVIKDCGHWTQQEKPDEVNRLLLSWASFLRDQ